jgi:two-component system sensor histidine kinase KdpD
MPPAIQPEHPRSQSISLKGGPAIARIVVSLALISAITFIFSRVIRLNALTVGFSYLVAILVLAASWGAVESILASLLAVACLNFFFLPPVGTFTIADPQNWIALFAFLVTSIVASQLAERARRRAQEAMDRQQDLEKLYALSRAILLIDPGQPAAKQIAHRVAQAFDFRGVMLFERATGEIYRAGPENIPEINDRLREAALQGTEFHDEERQIELAAIRLGGEPIGSLAICGTFLSDTALQALCNLVAGGLEKARAQQAISLAEAARQSQEFKSMLLDAIAHEFNTPLASIKTATSSILSGIVANPGDVEDMLSIADKEADRLKRFVADAVELARIDAARVELEMHPHAVNQVIRSLCKEMDPVTESRLTLSDLLQGMPFVPMDGKLMKLAIRQLVDNALKYSAPTSTVEISVSLDNNHLIVAVKDRGHGIPESARAKIFERFFRLPEDRSRIPGTGMGLAIARQIVEAHGGSISVHPREGGGSIFSIIIPVNRQEVSS